MSYHHFTILIIVPTAEYFTVIALGFYCVESFSLRGAFLWGLNVVLSSGRWHLGRRLAPWLGDLFSDVKFTSLYVTLTPFLIYFLTLNSMKTPEISLLVEISRPKLDDAI